MEILSNILKNWTFIFHLTPNLLFLHQFEILGARMTLAWSALLIPIVFMLFDVFLVHIYKK